VPRTGVAVLLDLHKFVVGAVETATPFAEPQRFPRDSCTGKNSRC
jgi:hypothetical protein